MSLKKLSNDKSRRSIVIAFGQPLFALAKKIQWVYPDRYGSDKLTLMGDWLEDSGWTTVIHNSGITEVCHVG